MTKRLNDACADPLLGHVQLGARDRLAAAPLRSAVREPLAADTDDLPAGKQGKGAGLYALMTIRPDGSHLRTILPFSSIRPRGIDLGPRP